VAALFVVSSLALYGARTAQHGALISGGARRA